MATLSHKDVGRVALLLFKLAHFHIVKSMAFIVLVLGEIIYEFSVNRLFGLHRLPFGWNSLTQ